VRQDRRPADGKWGAPAGPTGPRGAMRWLMPDPDPVALAELRRAGLPFPLPEVLARRGVRTAREARYFLEAGYEDLGDPFALPAMREAVAEVLEALDAEEGILVWGDYDVDGIAATAVVSRILKVLARRRGRRLFLARTIPHRLREGYGVHPDRLRAALARGAPPAAENGPPRSITTLIAVDTGTTACEAMELAAALGVRRRVVVDHHEPEAALPRAHVVNPHLPASRYGFRDLAGAAVAFALARALMAAAGQPPRDRQLVNLLELVGIATVADVLPLLGENRVYVRAALDVANGRLRYPDSGEPVPVRPGVAFLLGLDEGRSRPVTPRDFGFVVGPALNALGRTGGDAADGVRFLELPRGRPDLVRAHGQPLREANRRRQAVQERIVAHVLEAVGEAARGPRAVVFADDFEVLGSDRDIAAGVVGVAAARVGERLYRPCLLAVREGDEVRGSGRAVVEGFDLFGALEPLFRAGRLKGGGHRAAIGFHGPTEALEEARAALDARLAEMPPEALVPALAIDAVVRPEAVGRSLLETLARLEPFGMGNPAPVLLVPGCRVLRRRPGERPRRLVLELARRPMDAVLWDAATEPPAAGSVDVVCRLGAHRGALELDVLDARGA
jgi:single-stranded-DNA-specific exonuclease